MIEGISWLGHASFKIRNDKVVYIDPWKLGKAEPGDIILVTHSHYDHCSPQDVAKLQRKGTVIVTVADCASKFRGDVRILKPGGSLKIEGVTIEAVPAYNIDKPNHPKVNGWVGFIIEMGGRRIYHAGDTDLIPEISKVKVDIVLLPVAGPTMTAEEAAQAAERINPQVAIPMHYGDFVGSRADAEKFKRLCSCEVRILEPER